MKFDEKENDEKESDDLCESFDTEPADLSAREERLTARAIRWVRRTWSSLKVEERRVSLADLLRLFLCLVVAMTLITVAMTLIRFSLTREGAIFWLIVSIIILIKMRHRIFRH